MHFADLQDLDKHQRTLSYSKLMKLISLDPLSCFAEGEVHVCLTILKDLHCHKGSSFKSQPKLNVTQVFDI